MARRDWRGRPLGRSGGLRAARGHVHAGGHVRRRRASGSTTCAELGITAIELMPLADFPGQRNWGYDGVLPFAPDASYGTPEDLKRLVDAAHAARADGAARRRLQPLRPRGQLPARSTAPQFFTERHQTPWGAAINFDGAGSRTVRDFFIHNALYWLEEYHFDGLRLDAVHAILDDSRRSTSYARLATAVRDGPGASGTCISCWRTIATKRITSARDPHGRAVIADAQWNDDVHHALHVSRPAKPTATTPTTPTSRCDASGAALPKALRTRASPRRSVAARARGEPSAPAAAERIRRLTLQTHDQVGNRALRRAPVDARRCRRAARGRGHGTCCLPRLCRCCSWARSSPRRAPFPVLLRLRTASWPPPSRSGRRNEFARFARFSDPESRGGDSGSE